MAESRYVNTNPDVASKETLTKFDSFFVNRYADSFVTGYSFIFITKPSLFIFPLKANIDNPYINLAYENMIRDQFFSQFIIDESMNQNDRIIAEQLSFFEGKISNSFNKTNFLPMFTNRARGFTSTDIVMEQQEAFMTKQGFKMPMPTHKTMSEAANSLSIPMYETPNLDVTKTLSLWVNYISNITDGTFHANPLMVKNGIIDYMSSAYYFVLEPDGRTLKYWAKYTGCWPNQVPFSQLSFRKGDSTIVEVEANFIYTSKEDMNVAILEDFNRVSLNISNAKREENDEDYLSGKKSLLLNREQLISNPNFIAAERAPLVYYNRGTNDRSTNSTPPSDRFELSFGPNDYDKTFVSQTFEEDYFFKENQFFGSKLNDE
jgi:hypothetical protein